MATIGVERLGRALNLTRSRIAQLVHEGMPKQARGQYDFFKCAAWYIRYLQRALEKGNTVLDGGPTGEREERIRLLRVIADSKELELSRERSKLVAIDDVDQTMADLVRTTKAHIMAIPSRLAPELIGENSRLMIEAKINKAIREALSRLARRANRGV